MTDTISTSLAPGELLRALFIRLTLVILMIGALLFGPAGSFDYWNGWVFMAAFFGPMTGALAHFYRNDRAFLLERMRTDEKQKEQKIYAKLSLLWFIIWFAIPGFDYRFGWSHVPAWLVVAAVIVMITGYTLFILVMVQNRYASRVIEIQAGQHLIDTGMYSVVRHPMYAAALIMFTPYPLVLGSYYALIPTLLLPPLLIYRLKNEEKVLLEGLPGYADYTRKVKYRLIPFVW